MYVSILCYVQCVNNYSWCNVFFYYHCQKMWRSVIENELKIILVPMGYLLKFTIEYKYVFITIISFFFSPFLLLLLYYQFLIIAFTHFVITTNKSMAFNCITVYLHFWLYISDNFILYELFSINKILLIHNNNYKLHKSYISLLTCCCIVKPSKCQILDVRVFWYSMLPTVRHSAVLLGWI